MNGDILKLPEAGATVFTIDSASSSGVVIERINRFVVSVNLKGGEVLCHLHDPGRLKELIFAGNEVLIRRSNGVKTSHSITAAKRDGMWILTDSRFHNRIASTFLPSDCVPEFNVGKKRIDFACGRYLIEVKGSTLCEDGVALFPDAPSVRASEHMRTLRDHVESGNKSMSLILVFSPDALSFSPNTGTDPEFARELYLAKKSGVEIRVLKFEFDGNSIHYSGEIPSMIHEPEGC